ncbi:hypothetical protein K8I28_02305 [bacterium]|nr:hypothetical protein [bacterium]
MEELREIPVVGPFRLSSSLQIMMRHEHFVQLPVTLNRYHFSLEVPGGAVEVRLHQDKLNEPLKVRIFGDLVDDETCEIILETVTRMFSLHVDSTSFFNRSLTDETFRQVVSIHPDLRPVVFASPLEAIVRWIVSKNLTQRQTAMLVSNLKEVCGVTPAGRPHAPAAFPGKYTLLSVPERMMIIAGLTAAKARRIKVLVSSLVGDPDPLEHLLDIPNPLKARRVLLDLPGINPLAAEQLLISAYGYQDFLSSDTALFRAVKHFYGLPEPPDLETLTRIAEAYIPWRSWWSFLLKTAAETTLVT